MIAALALAFIFMIFVIAIYITCPVFFFFEFSDFELFLCRIFYDSLNLRHLILKDFHLIGCYGICLIYDCRDLVDVVSDTRDVETVVLMQCCENKKNRQQDVVV